MKGAHVQVSTGAAFVGLAVILGAFGAHGLRSVLSEYGLAVYEKGILYHTVHALGIIAVGCTHAVGLVSPRRAATVTWMFTAGIVLFSGSLYVLAVTEMKWLGMITPLGGTAFIVGWWYFAWSAGNGGGREMSGGR